MNDFFNNNICVKRVFCNVCRDLEKGRTWRTQLFKRFPELNTCDFECSNGFKWGDNPPPPFNPSQVQPAPPPVPPVPPLSEEKWLEIKQILTDNNDTAGLLQWKVLEAYEHNPNKHGCQCRKWKQELLDYTIRKGYSITK